MREMWKPPNSTARKATELTIDMTCAMPALLLVALIIIANCSILVPQVKAVPDGSLLWTQTINPSSKFDRPEGVAVDSTGIYAVGYDNSPGGSDSQWRIEKRSLTTGELIWGQTSNPTTSDDSPNGVAVDSSGVYIVGYDSSGDYEWRIEKRSLTTGELIPSFGVAGVIQENPSPGYDSAAAVAVDSSGIYVIGRDATLDVSEWRIEKRSLTTGLLIANFGIVTSNPSSGWDVALGIAVDSSGIYIVGVDESLGDRGWRVEKRSLTTGGLLWGKSNNPSAGKDYANGVAVDSSGVYIVGYDSSQGQANPEWRIEKRSLTTGNLIPSFGAGGVIQENPSPGYDEAYGVAVDSTGIYVVGYDNSPGGSDAQWRIEKRSLTTGSLMVDFGAGGVVTNNPSLGGDQAYRVALGSMYVVGNDNSPGGTDTQWRIEKRNLNLPASKLVITAYPSSVTAVSWSTKYTIQRQDQYGNPVTSGSTTVNLASTSTGTDKRFAETAGGASVISVVIPDGSSTKDFYYYDGMAGAWTISVSSAGLTGDSKPLTVNPKAGCIIATATFGS